MSLRDDLYDLRNCQTVKELRNAIKDLPDDLVILNGLDCSGYLNNFNLTIQQVELISKGEAVGKIGILYMGDDTPVTIDSDGKCIPISEE